ncbi:MAG: SpoIID/LytB domain-containing protein [Chroococcidiopsidaceae cyanobacterium CP_BM_ER_R8_30]|nr:SpoIID/LytB domain-containing protein [Chroococcidiopsidaceae cyanobacterium CP_BM_ER_R8_30]
MPRNSYTPRQVSKLPHRKLRGLKWLCYSSFAALTTSLCLLGISATSVPLPPRQDVESHTPPETASAALNLLKIGILQRFGEQPTDQLKLQATPGDRLTLSFKIDTRQQTIQANSVKLEVMMQPLRIPVVEERVVLSTHRSFESAEYSAQQWRSQGIEVEIAQPKRWEVWAKREVYNTPLLRRLLLQSLQAAGVKTAYMYTQIWKQVPQVIWFVDGNRYSFQQLDIAAGKNLIFVQGENEQSPRLYAGRLQLLPNAYGTYTLINDVPLETYLRGVVPNEIEANSPEAALEAQAIIARTYVLRNLYRFAIDGYELCASIDCQVYLGLTGTDANADRAIAATRGQVLTYHNQLADAVYSSTTGGVTAAFNDVWNGAERPYLQPVVDAASKVWNLKDQSLADEKNFQRFIELRQGFNETGARMFRWRFERSIVKIARNLQRYLKTTKSSMANFKTLQQLEVVQRAPDGRILKLAVKTDLGTFTLEKDEVRNAFSAPKSTLFYLQPLRQGKDMLWGYAFVGGGLGHGVGLSQTGCQELAKLGWSSSRILNFYYPGTQIQQLGYANKP